MSEFITYNPTQDEQSEQPRFEEYHDYRPPIVREEEYDRPEANNNPPSNDVNETFNAQRETINELTGGKIELVQSIHIEGNEEAIAELNTKQDVQEFRHVIAQVGDKHNMPHELMHDLELAVAEAANNAVDFGPPVNVQIRTTPKKMLVYIKDHGPGIDQDKLSQIFKHGESTRQSLGNGMTLIKAVADHTQLKTAADGTEMAIEQRLHATHDELKERSQQYEVPVLSQEEENALLEEYFKRYTTSTNDTEAESHKEAA
jgi:anti-sigma regulatory factor (Ser/Thr protein kinase)